MKLWVDDLRPAPDESWTWVVTAPEAVRALRSGQVEVMSLDHDLGDDGDTRMIIYWLIHEWGTEGRNWWPAEVRVHSMNNVGRAWLLGMIERYQP